MSKRNQLNILVVLLAFMLVATNASAVIALDRGVTTQIIYVDAQAAGVGNGQSWTDAYNDLQSALTEARTLAPAENVQIWVANGIYKPIDGITPTGNPRYEAFELISNVELYGGFVGSESVLEARDWRANPTVLSGDIDGNDIVNAIGVTEHFDDIVGDNSLHVVRAQDVDDSARLDGFYITGGLANLSGLVDGTFNMRNGAGLHLVNSAVNLARLQIQGNRTRSSGAGGGAYIENSAGGGIPAIQMRDVHFINNFADFGGGLRIVRAPSFIDGAVIGGNEADSGGGGINMFLAAAEFRNVLITGNQSALGGGTFGTRANAAFVNSQFSGNLATLDGGAYYFNHASSIDGTTVLTNTVLSGNRAGGIGGGVFHVQPEQGTMLINNSILWNNQDSSGLGTVDSNYGGPGATRFEASHSLIQGINPAGEGNFDGTISANDPLFLNPVDPVSAPTEAGEFRVQSDSPVIDRGTGSARVNPRFSNNNPPPIPIEGEIFFDLDGNPRFQDGSGDGIAAIDLGPFEVEGLNFTVGGETTGLTGEGLVLLLNDSEPLPISANGPFVFATALSDGSDYTVEVASQPIRPPQFCEVSNASGEVSENITTVDVVCTDRADSLFDDSFEPID